MQILVRHGSKLPRVEVVLVEVERDEDEVVSSEFGVDGWVRRRRVVAGRAVRGATEKGGTASSVEGFEGASGGEVKGEKGRKGRRGRSGAEKDLAASEKGRRVVCRVEMDASVSTRRRSTGL